MFWVQTDDERIQETKRCSSYLYQVPGTYKYVLRYPGTYLFEVDVVRVASITSDDDWDWTVEASSFTQDNAIGHPYLLTIIADLQ